MIIQILNQPFPVMNLGDIVLRELEESDAEDYFGYMSKIQMREFLTDANFPKNIEHALQELRYWGSLFRNKRSFYWGIAEARSNKLIGTIGFNIISITHLKAEISYDLDYTFWGRGIMLKSLKNIMRFAESVLYLARIQATVLSDNERSTKVLERCGFNKEGILRKYEVVNGVHKDYDMYAKTN